MLCSISKIDSSISQFWNVIFFCLGMRDMQKKHSFWKIITALLQQQQQQNILILRTSLKVVSIIAWIDFIIIIRSTECLVLIRKTLCWWTNPIEVCVSKLKIPKCASNLSRLCYRRITFLSIISTTFSTFMCVCWLNWQKILRHFVNRLFHESFLFVAFNFINCYKIKVSFFFVRFVSNHVNFVKTAQRQFDVLTKSDFPRVEHVF